MINHLATYVAQFGPEDGPIVIGVTGIDASGKSTMTTMLEATLVQIGRHVQIIRLDDFHRPRIERYRHGLTEPEQYFDQSFDIERLTNEILRPIRDEGILETTLVCLDVSADTWSVERNFSVKNDTIILLDGVFLFRPELSQYVDLMIFLRVDEGVAIDRALARDSSPLSEEILRKYQTKYLPAQRTYLATYPAERNADIILDNNDWNDPRLIKWPQ